MQISLPIRVGKSPTLKGIRGVLAGRKIKKGEIIEACPVILIPRREWGMVNETVFGNYKYEWNSSYDCLVLGYCGLVNHSYEPNAKYACDYKNLQMVYEVIKDIKKGEEVFVNYNGKPDRKRKLRPEYTDFRL